MDTRPLEKHGERLVAFCKLCARITENFWLERKINGVWRSSAVQKCPHCRLYTVQPCTWENILDILERKPHRAAVCEKCGELQPGDKDTTCFFCGEKTLSPFHRPNKPLDYEL